MRNHFGVDRQLLTNWRQILPSLVTLAAMLSGFLSILVTIEGLEAMPVSLDVASQRFRWSALLIMLALILDGLDGNLARWLKGTSAFGAELDTYVDLTAFGIAPAVLIFAVSLQSKEPLVRVLLPSAVAVSGVVRLARFKVRDPLRGQGGYAGLPITANASWVALLVLISQTPPRDRFSLAHGPMAALFLLGIFIFIVLQVTTVHYPKPTKKAAMFVPMALMVAALLLLGHFQPVFAARLATFMIVLGAGYVALGPLFVKGVAAHKAIKARKEAAQANGSNREL